MKLGKVEKTVFYILLTVFAFYFLLPFVWMVLTALKSESEAYTFPPSFLPKIWHLDNFVSTWTSQPFNQYLKNSIIVTVLTTAGQIISCSMVAYGFARYDFKGKKVLFSILLSTMMLPWDVTAIPLYMEFKSFGWINTLKTLIVPTFFGSAYYIFLLHQTLATIPRDLEEAAKIDGANDFQVFTRIFLPMMRPVLNLIGVLNIITVWNDYLGPLVFLNNRDKYTLALGLAAFKGVHTQQIVPTMAITVIMVILPLIAFGFAQKYIIEGMSGALKG